MNKRRKLIANHLKEFRLKNGFTQKQVSKLLGLHSEDRISHWEKGNNVPHLVNLVKLSKIYKATVSDLYPTIE